MTRPHITLDGIRKGFGGRWVIDGVSLQVARGEIIALLGPSGCGKTTLLRCIAGLEQPDAGTIRIGERTVFSAQPGISEPPERRGIGLVFQSYALWPHLTVGQNVAYGLSIKRVPKPEIARRVDAILATVGLAGLADRYPGTMSGGQQQRVALARSLVVEAEVILFDEPLSNLDLKLREEMRTELRLLLQRVGVTGLFVTHDQGEALVLADRIGLMHGGKLLQLDAPRTIYQRPQTRFAMEFLGSANILPGTVQADGGAGRLLLPDGRSLVLAVPPPQGGLVGIRPEKIGIVPRGAPGGMPANNTLDGMVTTATFLGNYVLYRVDCGGLALDVQSLDPDHGVGDAVVLHLPAEWLIGLEA